MKICEDCFGKLWPGLVVQAQAQGKILHIQKREIEFHVSGDHAGRCDYCGFERRIVFEVWFE
ncbi:hypothetical protein ES703_112497 [subsurface metagenome]